MNRFADRFVGEVVVIEHYGPHHGIIMDARPTSIVVAYSSSKERHDTDKLCVQGGTLAHKMLSLRDDAPTYFRASQIAVVTDETKILKATGKRWPIGKFQELERLVEARVGALRPVSVAQPILATAAPSVATTGPDGSAGISSAAEVVEAATAAPPTPAIVPPVSSATVRDDGSS